jgi:hypothetical protein
MNGPLIITAARTLRVENLRLYVLEQKTSVETFSQIYHGSETKDRIPDLYEMNLVFFKMEQPQL